jgi:hypothetical protein
MNSRPTLLALFTLMVLVVPAGVLQAAIAQDFTDTTDQLSAQELIDRTFQGLEQEADQEQEIDQDQDQTQEASNEADQSNTADVSQDETNEQSNALVTGDNTASTTQAGENTAAENIIEAASEGGSADAKAKKKGDAKATGGDSGDASGSLSQAVDNEATTIQDSSADENVLTNENTFGDDLALIDQDNLADQDAANVGLQDQDATQDQDLDQLADQFLEDINFQYGFTQQADDFGTNIGPGGTGDGVDGPPDGDGNGPPDGDGNGPPDGDGNGPPDGDGEFCLTATIDGATPDTVELCFALLELCEGTQATLEALGHTIDVECHFVPANA